MVTSNTQSMAGRVVVVVGPPCAGKSTYVQGIRSVGNVVIDYDVIAKALGSSTPHGTTGAIRRVALAARRAAINKVLAGVEADAFIIHTMPSQEQVDEYEAAGAEFRLIDPGKEECLRRAQEEGRPKDVLQAINRWYTSLPFKLPTPKKGKEGVVTLRVLRMGVK